MVTAGEFREACKVTQLEGGKPVACRVGDHDILVCKGGSGIYTVVNRCTHADAQLDEGRVRRDMIICPLHGARFDLASGTCIGGLYRPLTIFETKVEGDSVLVRLP